MSNRYKNRSLMREVKKPLNVYATKKLVLHNKSTNFILRIYFLSDLEIKKKLSIHRRLLFWRLVKDMIEYICMLKMFIH